MARALSRWIGVVGCRFALVLAGIFLVPALAGCGGGDEKVASPPSLRDTPLHEVPGVIAYVAGKRLEFDACIAVLPASGAAPPRTVTCDFPARYEMVWMDESRLGLLEYAGWGRDWFDEGAWHHEPEQRVHTLDLASGVVTPTDTFGYLVYGDFADYTRVSVHGERATVDDGGRLFVDSREVARFEGAGEDLHVALWSPDGEWLLLRYNADESDELWVVRRDGAVRGTLATDAEGDVTWIIPGLGVTPMFVPGGAAAPSASPTPTPYPVLPAPVLRSPQEGSTFDHFPRGLRLEWEPVAGAETYLVEVEYCEDPGPPVADACADWSSPLQPVVREPHLEFRFVGAQAGRWRVQARAAGPPAGASPFSPWQHFRFSR